MTFFFTVGIPGFTAEFIKISNDSKSINYLNNSLFKFHVKITLK